MTLTMTQPATPETQPDSRQRDVKLIQRIKAGDQEAFRELVSIYTPRVFRLVHNLLGNSGEAEDVTQEVFFKVYRKLDSFREDSSFYTWLYRVAFNTAADHRKKRQRKKLVLMEDLARIPVADPKDSPEDHLIRRDLQQEVRDAMAQLPEKFRTVLCLRELEGMTYEEISVELGLQKGTVESRIFRARNRLKAELERRLKS